jgi:formiminotetrahydrofolate cyclodeaminase
VNNESDLKKMAAALKRAGKTRERIAALRDKLRDDIDDLQGIKESMDDGIDGFDDAYRAMTDAIDRMSEYV